MHKKLNKEFKKLRVVEDVDYMTQSGIHTNRSYIGT